jgi:tRNA G10  N-methylase Trm11
MKAVKKSKRTKKRISKVTAKVQKAVKIKRQVNFVKEQAVGYKIHPKKVVDESWDFRKANTKEYTHCFHQYPAMMIPQVARRIIERYGNRAKILFDPYCGTGTSLVEANLKGINAIGTDINPLARLIATAKTTKIDIQVLDLFLHDFNEYIFSINFEIERIKSVIIPEVKNIDFWFSKSVQEKLGVLLGYIEKINDLAIKRFFKVGFSETVREVSYNKAGEFKLVRSKNLKERENIDVFGIMISKLLRNKKGIIEFEKACLNGASTDVYEFNTVQDIPCDIIKPDTIDIVITSPPYGDSRTTVAYGQYSRLANEWLGNKEANQIDNMLMGGRKRKHQHIFNSDTLNDTISTIQKRDSERARDVISFYEDYEQSIDHVSSTIRKRGYACYVVGNRTVKGIQIPNDEITSELFKRNDFTHIETIIRNIPNKRMPSKNSPSNIVGETAPTMKNEFIVICQKN